VVSARLGQRTVTRLRKRLFAHMLELPALFFTGQRAGDLSSRVISDVGSIQYLLTSGLVGLVRAILTLAGALVLMVGINPRLTGVVVLLIPSTILLVRIFGQRLQKLSRTMYDELGHITSHVQEAVADIRGLKVYNNQNHENRRFAARADAYRDAGIRRAWLSAALESAIQISLWVCLIVIVVYGFALAARGRTTNGELVAFLLLAFRVAIPLSSLTGLFGSAQGAVAAAGRLDDVFAVDTERTPGAPVPAPRHGAAAVSLRGVGFAYPEAPDQPVLADLDLEIPAGQRLGVVGTSGAGKTTLIGLVMGLFPPSQGTLLLDGRPYGDFELAELRSHMAFVAQEPLLNDQSVAANIRFGLPEADDAAVRDAAARAGVMDFVADLPQGLDTPCGERGARLSGGQRQRVALARAFLRDPGILILDEPTSALDAAAEDRIRRTMRQLMEGRTTIVISHRFSLVRDLDRILVLSDGRILEDGNHAELLANESVYHHLYGLQAGDPAS
jgi:ABC-type multidrug transport system fused ATPase/permease subunit